jgi:hypothetical protein
VRLVRLTDLAERGVVDEHDHDDRNEHDHQHQHDDHDHHARRL